MSELRWDPENWNECNAARESFRLFVEADYYAYAPSGARLKSFDDATEGAVVFRKVPRRSALERLLDEDEHGNDRDGTRG